MGNIDYSNFTHTMAELPNLGKNCALASCQLLDYTPFECRDCKLHFCSTHRFAHGCANKDSKTLTEIPDGSDGSVLRPYVCSFKDCHGAESIKVVCPGCEQNFCLKHRLDSDHGCASLVGKTKKEVPTALLAQVAKEQEEKQAQKKETAVVTGVATTRKVLSAEEQKRADRVAVMKMKMKNKGDDMAYVFVETDADGQRRVIGVGKTWSVGRCVDEALKSFVIPNENSVFGAKRFRFFTPDGAVIDESGCLMKIIPDLGTVHLRKEE